MRNRLLYWLHTLAGGDGNSWVLSSGETRAAIDLDFEYNRAWTQGVTMPINQAISWTRNNIAYYTTSAGVLVPFSANQPRIGDRGLLVEGTRTNHIPYSQTFSDASWSPNNVTITVNNAVAPDGTTTAALIYPTTSGTARRTQQSGVVNVNGVAYTTSFYAKYAGGTPFVYVFDQSGANVTYFNIQTGVIGTRGASHSASSIEALANGWYRCKATGTGIDAANFTGYIGLADADANDTATANGTNGIYLWGAQSEIGAFASSYIVTPTAAAVARPTEETNFLNNFSTSGLSTTGPWTMRHDLTLLAGGGPYPNDPKPWEFASSDRSQTTAQTEFVSSGRASAIGRSPAGFATSVEFALGGITGLNPALRNKTIFRAIDGGTGRISSSGQSKLDASANNDFPSQLMTSLRIGAGPSEPFWGHIHRLSIWNVALGDAAMDALVV